MRRWITVHRFLLVLSAICLVVAWLAAIGGFDGWNDHSWAYAGLALYVAAQLA